jgi:murein DD-endopeptidase MepM/ murein hydrolase activator NlpD
VTNRELRLAQEALESFARDTYINGDSQLATSMLLLDSNGPADLIERAGLLAAVATSRAEVLERVVAAQASSAAAETEATDALGTEAAAEAQARATLAQATAMLEEQEAKLPALLAQQAQTDATFYAALMELLGPEGAAAAFAQYELDVESQYSAEAAARAAAYDGGPVLSGSWALPLAGRFTSCFCQRWGSMHWGIDIAAPMYTPMYSAGDGVVVKAGSAAGFGLAVYIRHDNGDVTVYGHMEVIKVVTGQRVTAGQEIALVGSRGFSTGPHLHFEVYIGGLDGVRVDPVRWLASRGIYV